MEATIFTVLAIIIGMLTIMVLAPVLLFKPLVNAISDRIAGKKGNTDEVKILKARVDYLESELQDLRMRHHALEDSYEFSRRLTEQEKAAGKD